VCKNERETSKRLDCLLAPVSKGSLLVVLVLHSFFMLDRRRLLELSMYITKRA